MKLLDDLRRVLGTRRAFVFGGLAVVLLATAAYWQRTRIDPSLVAVVRRGSLTAVLTTSGSLRPLSSTTYRSPIVGRDAEIRELAPEGTRVNEGDLLIRFGSTELEIDRERIRQELRQAELDVQVADGEFEEAEANVQSVSEGEGAVSVEEARTNLQAAERRVERLRRDYAQLKPLFDKGFMTRDELAKTSDELDQAEAEFALARRRTGVVVDMTHPREQKRAEILRAQKASARAHAHTRIDEARLRLAAQTMLIEACSVYARHAGLVVYEELLGSNPRRKIRVGDRVYSTQALVTIPEVDRMAVETTVSEADMHRVRIGQTAAVRVEAYPDLRLTGHVRRVGALASTSTFRPLDDKRFDLVVDLDESPADLRPEMTARADVQVGTRENVLLVPVTAVFKKSGVFVAYAVTSTGITARAVELGQASDQVVEVVSGLGEGDRISLVEPPQAADQKPVLAPTPAGGPAAHAGQPR